MSAKILNFELPKRVIKAYEEPLSIFEEEKLLETIEFDAMKTLGPVGEMISQHRHAMLNWIDASDFMKPYSDWKGTTKEFVIQQRLSFNSKIEKLRDSGATLIGGEKVVLKRGEFVIKDISDEVQEVSRILGVVPEVLFFEATVYCPHTLSYMRVLDYQIKELIVKDE